MFAIILGALVVAFSIAQFAVCPLWYPTMCAPAMATAIIFGFLGIIGIIGGIGVHAELQAKRRAGTQDLP